MSPSRNLSKILLLVAVVAALGLTACGGDGDTTTVTESATVTEGSTDGEATTDSETATLEEGSPEEVTRSFLLALANGDGEAACASTSAAAIAEIEAQGTCEEAVLAAVGEATEEDILQVEQATYELVKESETSASVSATRPDGSAETFTLVLEDGVWKVDG